MKLLTNGPNINPDDGWQNNTLLDNADPPGYVRFSINMFHATTSDPAPPQGIPFNPLDELVISPEESPLGSPSLPPLIDGPPPAESSPYVRFEHTQASSALGTPATPVAPENATAWDTPRHRNISTPSYGTPMREEVNAYLGIGTSSV